MDGSKKNYYCKSLRQEILMNRKCPQFWNEIVREYRKQANLNQEQLAEQLGISRNYLSQIERGKAFNLSFDLALKILNLGEQHDKIEVVLPRRVMVDASIAAEIVFLNHAGVVTESSCQGPPAMALIKPSSVKRANELGYETEYLEDIGLFEIRLRSSDNENSISRT